MHNVASIDIFARKKKKSETTTRLIPDPEITLADSRMARYIGRGGGEGGLYGEKEAIRVSLRDGEKMLLAFSEPLYTVDRARLMSIARPR